MAELKDRIENVLNETRILLLGGQVLLGFTYRVYFEPGFDRLPRDAQIVQTLGLVVLTAGLGWLISPASFHQIAERGDETLRVHDFTNRILDWGLLPFALGIGLALYPVSVAMRAPHPAIMASLGTLFALSLWYAFSFFSVSVKPEEVRRKLLDEERRQREQGPSDFEHRIKIVLIECRMALPGAQALLGFQLANVFTQGFEKLPRSSQWIHFGSLLSTMICTILLIAPAPYHRIAEGARIPNTSTR